VHSATKLIVNNLDYATKQFPVQRVTRTATLVVQYRYKFNNTCKIP